MASHRQLYWWMCVGCVVLSVVLTAFPANRWKLVMHWLSLSIFVAVAQLRSWHPQENSEDSGSKDLNSINKGSFTAA